VNTVSLRYTKLCIAAGAPKVTILLEGVVRRFVIDTGSTISLIQPGISRAKVAKTDIAPIASTGKVLPLQGEQEIECTIAGKVVRQRVGVCALPTEAEGLLGTDFMKANDARVDVANHRLELDVPSLSSPGAECKGWRRSLYSRLGQDKPDVAANARKRV
jgi:hypothetical protein